jgi:hypothetical protein
MAEGALWVDRGYSGEQSRPRGGGSGRLSVNPKIGNSNK